MAHAQHMQNSQLVVKPRSIGDQIADAIASDIIHGRLPAGQKLQETELAKRFNVSRGPVREALDLLERNMLVNIKPRSFTEVNTLSVKVFSELFDIRRHMMGLAASYAARNRTETEMAELKATLKRLEPIYHENADDYMATLAPNNELWNFIYVLSHSRVIRQATRHFVGQNIWAIALSERVAKSSPTLPGKDLFAIWHRCVSAIAQSSESRAFKHGAAIVDLNWQIMRGPCATYFPPG